MTDYLSINKILRDGVALYKRHALYLTIMITAVVLPHYFLLKVEEYTTIHSILNSLITLATYIVSIISIKLVSTSYVDEEIILTDQVAYSIRKLIPFVLISYLSVILFILGFLLFIVPGVISLVYFEALKVDYVTSGRTLKESMVHTYKLFNRSILFRVMKVYAIPLLLLLLISFFTAPMISVNNFEEQFNMLYPYLSLISIVIFPINTVFITDVYYNVVKEGYRELQSSNELV